MQWIKEADFKVGLYTYNDLDYTWVVVGLLAFQFRIPKCEGRFGFLLTREWSWLWWGLRTRQRVSVFSVEILSEAWLTDHDCWTNTRSLVRRTFAVEGYRRNGRIDMLCLDLVSVRRQTIRRRWFPWLVSTRYFADFQKIPKRKGFHEHLLYELRKEASIEQIHYILHKDKRVISAMEHSDGLCSVGYLREHGGLRQKGRM